MIAGLLHGRIHLNMHEFRQQNHMTFFSNVLAILELLQPLVFLSDHQGALQDCLLSFMKVLQVRQLAAAPVGLRSVASSSTHFVSMQNFQRCRSPLVFITKFLQFTQKYITHNAAAAIPYLKKHSDILQYVESGVKCNENL